MLREFRSFVSRMKLDVLSSSSDWAFVMAEADALESEDPAGCVASALRRARGREARRYGLVAAELMRRAADRQAHAPAAPAPADVSPARPPEAEPRVPQDCHTP